MIEVAEYYKGLFTATINEYISGANTSLEAFKANFQNALNEFRKKIDDYYANTLGEAIDGQYNFNENGEFLNETNSFIMTGGPDLLFPFPFNMNVEFDNPPTILNCLISAPTGTIIQYNLVTVKTITAGIDPSSVENMGATFSQSMGFIDFPINRQLTEAMQTSYSITGTPGQEAIIHFLGWNK